MEQFHANTNNNIGQTSGAKLVESNLEENEPLKLHKKTSSENSNIFASNFGSQNDNVKFIKEQESGFLLNHEIFMDEFQKLQPNQKDFVYRYLSEINKFTIQSSNNRISDIVEAN